jgi:hypothetical protein
MTAVRASSPYRDGNIKSETKLLCVVGTIEKLDDNREFGFTPLLIILNTFCTHATDFCRPQKNHKKELSYRIVLSRLNSDAQELFRQFAKSSRLELPSLPSMRLEK